MTNNGNPRPKNGNPRPKQMDARFFAAGCVLSIAVGILLFWAFAIGNLTEDQRAILRAVLPLATGFLAGSFVGAFTIKANGWIPGIVATGTGGFGVWLLSALVLFPVPQARGTEQEEPFTVTVRPHGPGGRFDFLKEGTVILQLGNDQRREGIGPKGDVDFFGIPASMTGQSVPVHVIADGYVMTMPEMEIKLMPKQPILVPMSLVAERRDMSTDAEKLGDGIPDGGVSGMGVPAERKKATSRPSKGNSTPAQTSTATDGALTRTPEPQRDPGLKPEPQSARMSVTPSGEDVDRITSTQGAVRDLKLPTQPDDGSALQLVAIRSPADANNYFHHFYDVYLRNPTDRVIALVSVNVASHLEIPRGDATIGIIMRPDITYKLEYALGETKTLPLDPPYGVAPSGMGAFRLVLRPNVSDERLMLWDGMNHDLRIEAVDSEKRVLRLVDSSGRNWQ